MGAPLPKCYARNPRQGEYNDIFRYTIEEPRSVATEYATSNEAAKLHPAHVTCARVWDMREETFLWPNLLVGSQELDNYWFVT
jgi:hypothetical protein